MLRRRCLDAVARAFAHGARLKFVREWSRAVTMTELGAHYRISRKTGYKWVERVRTPGAPGLHDASRRPPTVRRRPMPAGRDAGGAADAPPALGRRRNSWRISARRDPSRLAQPIDGLRAAEGARVGGAAAPAGRRARVASPRAPSRPRTRRGPPISKATSAPAMASTAIP